MAEPDFQVSPDSHQVITRYVELLRNDDRRRELFSFLAEAVSNPNGVMFESDEDGLRWTRLRHVALVWRLDLPRRELDVIDVWDEND